MCLRTRSFLEAAAASSPSCLPFSVSPEEELADRVCRDQCPVTGRPGTRCMSGRFLDTLCYYRNYERD